MNPIRNNVVFGPLDPTMEHEPRQVSKPNFPGQQEQMLFEISLSLDWRKKKKKQNISPG